MKGKPRSSDDVCAVRYADSAASTPCWEEGGYCWCRAQVDAVHRVMKRVRECFPSLNFREAAGLAVELIEDMASLAQNDLLRNEQGDYEFAEPGATQGQSLHAALRELIQQGALRHNGEHRPARNGRMQMVWEIADKDAAARLEREEPLQ